jgi:hypothetical protein
MKQQLEDFKLKFDHIPFRCDNTSAIKTLFFTHEQSILKLDTTLFVIMFKKEM